MLKTFSPQKSTNVRTSREDTAVPPMRVGLRALTTLSPKLAANVAHRVLSTPRRHRRPDWEKALLQTAHPFPVRVGRQIVRAWTWGSGPTVILMHGWEGRGSQLGALSMPLVSAGFRVVAFDAPGHGDSPGPTTTVVSFAEALEAVASWVGGAAAVVAHSMGTIATALALHRGLEIQRAAFVASASSPAAATEMLTRILDLPPSVVDELHLHISNEVGFKWPALADGALMRNQSTPLLLLHDRDDRDVRYETAVRISELWPNSSLVLTHGLGHRRILRDSAVIEQVVNFMRPLSGEPAAAPDPWAAFLRMDLSTPADGSRSG